MPTRFAGIIGVFTGSTTLTIAPGSSASTTARISVATTVIAGATATVRCTATRGSSPMSASGVVLVTVR